MEVDSADSGGADYAVGFVRGPSAVQAVSSNPEALTVSSRPHRAGGADRVLSSAPVDRWAESFGQANSVRVACSVPPQLHFLSK